MTKLGLARFAALGCALAIVAGCDQVKSRVDAFGKLVGGAQNQLAGGKDAPAPGQAGPVSSALLEAPQDARAIAGVQLASVPYTPPTGTIAERMQTESFFAIGTVIAKPKEELTEPVVATETFDAKEADPAAAPAPEPTPETMIMQEPAPAAPPAGGAAPTLRRPPTMMKNVPKAIVRERLKIDPKKLEQATREATRDSGVKVTEETVKDARSLSERKIVVNNRTAQQVGDEIIRRNGDTSKPVPRVMSVRNKLNVERSMAARDRTFTKLETLGLSASVEPEENGTMRITLGVAPTQLPGGKIDPSTLRGLQKRFAAASASAEDMCATTPDAARLKADPILATQCAVKTLRESGEFEYVEKDYVFHHQMLRRPAPKAGSGSSAGPITVTPGPNGGPNDPLYSLQWDFKDLGAGAGQSQGGAGFGAFWQKAKVTGSKSVIVAIVDSGIQKDHPDFRNSSHIAPGWDMISDPFIANDGDNFPDADPSDPGDICDPADPDQENSYHGTHVAGTVGAGLTNNGAGIAGGAWDVTIVPVRALGRCGGLLSDINAGIRWAAGVSAARDSKGNEVWNKNPADIINLSIGLFEPCPASMQAAINDAVAAGAIVVVAAGNDRVDTKYYAPGGCKNVVSVAAGDGRGQIAPYSNFGDAVTMLAPGGDMTRDDDGDGRPDGILSTRMAKNCYDPVTKANVATCFYSYEQGTSMAAPHVTAALALLKSKFPADVPSDLTKKLLKATSPRTALQCAGKTSEYGDLKALAGSPGMGARPCGNLTLNLGNAPLQ